MVHLKARGGLCGTLAARIVASRKFQITTCEICVGIEVLDAHIRESDVPVNAGEIVVHSPSVNLRRRPIGSSVARPISSVVRL